MIDRPFANIAADDIQRLVDERTPERRTLEFKSELPGDRDSDRKEFLADVSSFANAAGGDLVFGVATRDGQAVAADGLALPNMDAAVLRLDQMIRSGISPRIVGFQIGIVPGLRNGPAIVIRIPRSFQGPHIISYQQHFRFFGRNAAGKFPMDVSDIRDAVLRTGSAEERIRVFRSDRLARIAAGETPVPLDGTKIICVHAVPFEGYSTGRQVDLVRAATRPELLEPFYASGWSGATFNIDGLYSYSPIADRPTCISYLQLLRNGTVETVDCAMIPSPAPYRDGIPSVAFPQQLFAAVGRIMRLYELLEVEPPYTLLVGVLGAMGVELTVDRRLGAGSLRPLDRDVVMLPEVVVDSRTFEPDVALRPMLDALWQSFGASGCGDYDDAGRWGRRR